jgi:glyoxylase-like metal-dependent hydrolase (beta-lactamase superfamily II)
MERIAERIFRIPPQREPLSADVFIIEGEERCYIFDAGSSDAAWEAIRGLKKPVTFILSHFHRDHTANLSRLEGEILGGARSCKYLGRGTRVDAPLTIRDGVTLLVQPCVSPHAPGCLILTVDDTYTFLGDLTYAQPGAGAGERVGMLRTLRAVKTQWFVESHREGFAPGEREAFLQGIGEER